MRQYPLWLDDVKVGSVSVIQEGLYCRINCISYDEHVYDCPIAVKTEDTYIHLGKCTKESDVYVLRRFMPAKMLGKGELVFKIGNDGGNEKNFMVLDPSKPFPGLALLPSGRFAIKQSKCGIVVEDKRRDLG